MRRLTSPEVVKLPIISQAGALSLDYEVDFSELDKDADHRLRRHCPLQLTSSTCGRYLLAFKNRNIFVFYLRGDTSIIPRPLHPGPQAIKIIPCPQRVLAVAMNTSSSSCSLVVLLEGRLGLTCNLTEQYDRRPSFVMPKVRVPSWTVSTNRQPGFLDDEVEVEIPLPLSSFVTDIDNSPSNLWALEDLPFTISPEQYSYENSPSPPAQFILHQDLCSANDPPISLAISSQRTCIAFGNSTGIELRWIDSVSGEIMIRWFDSSRVNHHLHFLPSRLDDAASKLRLVSSPAPPYQQFALLQRFRPDKEEEIENEMMWNSMSNLDFRDDMRKGHNKPIYYNLKPCSDGWHVLFLDAETENVCLGMDGQHGETAEDRISKKVIFLNPKTAETDKETAKPTCYAAATEIEEGPRVVVGYDSGDVYLFAIPSDIYLAGGGGKQWEWLQDWEAYGAVNGSGDGSAVWPVKLKGVKIGHVDDGLADVAIQGMCFQVSDYYFCGVCPVLRRLYQIFMPTYMMVATLTQITPTGEGGGVRVWAFSSHSRGFSWSLSNIDQKRVRRCKVLNDELGLRVEDEMDEEGDWHMPEAPPLRQYSGSDGCVSDSIVPNPLTPPGREPSDITTHGVDEDEGYFSGEDDQSTTVPNTETRLRGQKRLHNTLLQRSDVSMKDVAGDSYAPGAPYHTIGTPGTHYYPNKRRRLNNTPRPFKNVKRDTGDPKSSFDPDRQTIEWVGNAFAISVPSRKRRWSGSGVEAGDWIPDYLGMGEEWDEQVESEGEERVDADRAGDEVEDHRGLDLWSLARQAWDVDIL